MAYSGVIRSKHWFSLATDQLASRHPFAAGVAVSLLQDSVESLAHAAAGQVNASLPAKGAFVDYWDKFPPSKTLPFRTEMTALNNARVQYKHHGGLPASDEAERYAVDAHRFLVETARLFFDIDFDRLSEADLIANEKCRDLVRSAETDLSKGDFHEALKRCRDAMDVVEADLAKRVPWGNRSAFAPRVESFESVELYKWVAKELVEHSLAISLASVGVLPHEYRLATMLLPTPSFNRANYWFNHGSHVPQPNVSNVSETIRIIIRIALRIQSVADNLKRISSEFAKSKE
jgi:hypothetical protein